MNEYCIDYYVKPLVATRITKLGGLWGEKTEQAVINEITNMTGHYYIKDDGHVAWLEIEQTAPGSPYLKTTPDDTPLDNLMYLPRRYA
jgi:hypothetical protein